MYRIGESGHGFLHFPLAERTMDLRIPVDHQFVKAVVAVIAVIFIYGHGHPPGLLNVLKR
jgi:hypothetical protein